ncbi:MAG: sulfite exporter TauE/SafE family protein [Acidimicrobiia bacterium]
MDNILLLAVVAVTGLLIGFGKAGVAGTIGPFVTVLMALVLPAEVALGLLLPMLIVADGFAMAAYWRRWDLTALRRLLLAAVIGIVIGTITINSVDETVLRRVMALSILAFAALFVFTRGARMPVSAERRWAFAAGTTSGFVSTVAHSGGPPIVAYLMSTRTEPVRLVGTTVVYFTAVNLIKVPGYFYAGLFDGELILSTAPAWIFVPLGIVLGKRLVHKINTALFERLILVLLVAGALVLFVT